MDGVLVIDKPQGLTSHDVVVAARRLLGESRIGHTGTLDPLATGVLPMAIGRATRLVKFLASSDKEYEATIRFGLTTDSFDVTGTETSRTDAVPGRDEVVRTLRTLTGEYLQTPPAYSAKKVQGRRAYQLAREAQVVTLTPVPVRVDRADLLAFTGARARVALTCSAGFYVRSFANTVGELVGTGACLETLRRTRAGEFGLEAAISMDEIHDGSRVASKLVPLAALLGRFPAVTITDQGREDVAHGREIGPDVYVAGPAVPPDERQDRPGPGQAGQAWVRLLDSDGALVGVATAGRRPDSLHPSLVLI